MTSPDEKKRHIYLVDTTLRDGEQAPGVVFSPFQRLRLAYLLSEAGVKELEIGNPAMGSEECRVMEEIAKLDLPLRLTAWCRARKDDIDLACKTGVKSVHISFPVSPLHIRLMRSTTRKILQLAAELIPYAAERFEYVSAGALIPYAAERFEYVSAGAQDASRTERRFLQRFARIVHRVGVDRLRLADTVGVWNPIQTRNVFAGLKKKEPGLELGFHGHNDLGMATANALAAILGGADSVDVTVNGLGERAGNAPLEQVAMALKVSLGLDLSFNHQNLNALCREVSQISGRPIPADRPLVGSSVFSHESGVHVRGILLDPASYEPFSPQSVGRKKREFVVGKHSGRTALRHTLSRYGLNLDEAALSRLNHEVRFKAERLARSLSEEELLVLAQKVSVDQNGGRRPL
jgi:homocitrate synthase NifV